MKVLAEAATHRCSEEKVFWKNAANLNMVVKNWNNERCKIGQN